jgi:hypothetical protein
MATCRPKHRLLKSDIPKAKMLGSVMGNFLSKIRYQYALIRRMLYDYL